ncbi:MAG: hypothetical protein AAEJ52_06775 [Myxococcota bacterium]
MAVSAEIAADQVHFTADQILQNDSYVEPLIANGVRCHGGFDADGRYVSPRVLHRGPAIAAWQNQLARDGHELVEIPVELMPPQYPNLEQSVLLLSAGVRDPIVRALTIISIVEGFGAIIRDVKVPDLRALIREPIDATALAHLDKGLFEAHARDESGYRDEGGHKQMWEAARDLALENPKIPGDVLMRMMGRRNSRARSKRPFPQIAETLERMVSTMAQVLVVEVFAVGTFVWGETLLSNPKVSAAPDEAGQMVAYIRADESPHVEYLRTALSEIRARTIVTVDGSDISGRTVVDGLLHRILRTITRDRPQEQRADVRSTMQEAMKSARDPSALFEEFESLESSWQAPALTGFEPAGGA